MSDKSNVDSKKVSAPTGKGKSFALSAFIVAFGSIVVKMSGLVRDNIVAHRFTDDVLRDAYRLAFNIPDLFYNLLIGGAIFSTIAPYLSAKLAVGKEKEGMRTISIFLSVVGVFMLVVCGLGTIFSEQLYSLYALGKNIENTGALAMAAKASKWLFPQVLFTMLAALCNGVLISYRRFSITSFGPLIYNVLVIVAIAVFGGDSERNLVMTMAGIFVATALYFVCQYSLGFKQMKQVRFIFKPADKDFLMLFRRAIPILFSASIVQINVIVLNYFIKSFGDGYVYYYGNASTIWQLPYTIFVVAITTVMTPELAGDYESKNYSKASDLVSNSMRSALFMTIPSAGFIAVMSVDVVKAIYQWSGSYTDSNAQIAGTFLLGFSIAIISATVVHVFNQAFYAIGKTRIPMIAGVVGLVTCPLSCIILMKLGVGYISASLAYSAANIFQLILLAVAYCKNKELAPHGIIKFLLKSGVCAAVMAGIVFVVDLIVPAQGGKPVQLAIIALKGVLAVAVYFIMAIIMKMPEATVWIDKIKRKIGKGSKTNKATAG